MKKITVLFFFLLSICFVYGQEVTIGTGNIAQEYPLSNFYGYQRSAALYSSAEINQTGFVNKLAWDIGKVGDRRPVKIYLKLVEADTLVAANWTTLTAGATLVYTGSFFPTTTLGYQTINLDRSFAYTDRTKNVLVLVETNRGGAGIDEAEGLKIKASASSNTHLTTRVDNTNETGNLSFVSSRPNIKMMFGPEITCYGIQAVLDTVKAKSVRFSITSQTTTTSFSYEIRTSGAAGSGATGLAASGTITDLSAQPFVVRGLVQQTNYTLYVRASCANNQNSLYSTGIAFTTLQDIVTLPFTENFEEETSFYYVNDTNNKWHIGTAAHNGGTKGLYISKDNGQTNTYNNVGVQVSHAYMDVKIPEHAEDLEIKFDWRCVAQGNVKDYFRVWLVPVTYLPTVRSQITANATRVQLGRVQYYENDSFLNERAYVHVAPFAGEKMRLIFEWKQDASLGEDPPAAIDNINIKAFFCKKVASNSIQITNITATTGTVSWAASNAEAYEVYLEDTPDLPVDRARTPLPNGNNLLRTPYRTTDPTFAFTDLNPGTQYLVWVRAICESNKVSAWEGPKILATDMKPVALPYSEDFERMTNFEYKKNDSKNKWFVGNAVNNGGSKALYISENFGAMNSYTPTGTQVSHVYKDFIIPIGTQEAKINFNWRCVGEGTISDYFRVWVVPAGFTPSIGTQITAGPARIRLGGGQFHSIPIFKREEFTFDATAYAGQNMRLVFEWRQDASGGNQPPAAIDNLKVMAKSCVAPMNFRVIETRGTTATVQWNRVSRQNRFEIYYSTVNTPPDETVTGSVITTRNPYTITGLTPRTVYYVWIRTVCGENNRSFWVPLVLNTGQVPAEFPYNEDFDGDIDWDFSNPTVNKWVIGTAVHNGGTQSLYVTKDEGITNSYDVNVRTVAHAYRDIAIPMGVAETNFSFDWRCMGEGTTTKRDYFKVWLVPGSYMPVAGQQITGSLDDNRIQVGAMFNQQGNFASFVATDFDLNRFQGQVMRLVFEWNQDASSGDQPPAAIDNIKIEKGNCPNVRNLQSEVIEGASPASVLLTWDSYGDETEWEVMIFELEDPANPNTTPNGIIVNQPSYVFVDPDPTNTTDRFYRFYVRPICEGTNIKKWMGPAVISFIPPPGCAKVDADIEFGDIEGLTRNEKGEYIICDKGTFNFSLGASYEDIKRTEQYNVIPIPYRPPFPFTGGGAIQINTDDRWSDVINLGFDFCFFGNKYNNVLITDNGAITFSIKDVVPGGRYTAGSGSGYSMNTNPIPYNPGGTSPPYVDAIFGVLQDLDPRVGTTGSPPERSINYQIMGKAPCRTLVFNIYRLGLYSDGYKGGEDIDTSTQTTQVVLYEGTNIIEVYVKNRPAARTWNGGNGVLGIQNSTGTIAYVPPGRNVGRWTAQNEAWRFEPAGEATAEFLWEKDDEFFSNQAKIHIEVDKTVKYTAKAIYEICGDEETIITKEFIFLKEDFELGKVNDLIDCTKKPGEENIFNLRDTYPDIFGDLDPARYILNFYESDSDRALGINPLDEIIKYKGANKTIYIKLKNKLTGCTQYSSFKLGVDEPLKVTILNDRSVCGSYLLPKLAEEEEAYFTQPYGKGTKYEGGSVFSEIGIHTIYVYKEVGACYGQSQFKLEITDQPVADKIENMTLSCQVFTLPELSEYNKYFTKPNGEGQELIPGLVIFEPTTIYIFASNKGENGAFCVDESSFTIDFAECPIPKGISPNGDGVNDAFDLTGYGVSKIQIFNRNGMEVYSQGMYQKEWMGQDKSGNKLPSGTYFYLIIANGENKSGWVQINY